MAPQAKLVVEMTAEDARLFKSMQKQQAEQKQIEKGYGKIDKASERAGRKQREAFGGRTIGQLKSIALEMGGITAAINVAASAMRFYKEETGKAVDSSRQLVDSRRRLLQIARDARDAEALNRRADIAAAAFGVDRQTARDVLFAARSEGFEADFEAVLKTAPLLDVRQAATVAGQVPGLFEGQLDSRQALNAVLIASGGSRADFENIAQSLPTAAAGANVDAAETIAALAVLSKEVASPQEAANLIKTFGIKTSLSPELRGQSLLEATSSLAALPEEQRREFLKENEQLNIGFEKLQKNMALITAETDKLNRTVEQTGTDRDAIALGLSRQTQASRASFELERARIQREIVNEQANLVRGAGGQAALDRGVARLQAEGASRLELFTAQTLGDTALFAGGGEGSVDAATGSAQFIGPLGINYAGIARGIFGGGGGDELQQNTDAMRELTNEMRRNAPNNRVLSQPDTD